MDITPTGGHDDGSGTAGGGDLRLLTPEHVFPFHCKHDHYGPVSGGGMGNRDKDIQAVVRTGQSGCGGDTDGISGGGTDVGRGGDGRDRGVYGFNQWRDNISNITLGIENTYPPAYAQGL